MADDDDFVITVLQAHRGLAVKKRTRSAHGQVTKSDPTLNELHWRFAQHRTEGDVDKAVRFLRVMAPRYDLATVHGDPASGLDMTQWYRRLSADSHGPNRTIVEAERSAGAKASGLPLDPRPALPGQLFLTGRPLLFGLNDPVPRSLHAFVLPGRRQRVSSINWNEFSAPLAAYAESERRAHVAGAELGWLALLARYLGDGKGRLGFFKPLSIALGYAARSDELADEIVGVMHAIVSAHPDLNADRAGQYTPHWLRCELLRLRAKDASRDARSHAIRRRLLPTMSFDR